MYWLDLAIIYFALGAPFGVLRITAKRKVTPFAYLRMASGYVLWPLVAIRNVARFLTAKPAARVAQKDELESIRAELEKALFPNATSNELYAFREVFYRYTGLAQAIAEFRMQNAESDRFHSSFIIHNSPLVRSACLARRDREKLNAQLVNARQDFADTIAATNTKDTNHITHALAKYFDDNALVDTFISQ